MNQFIRIWALCLLIQGCTILALQAQPTSTPPQCGIREMSPEQARRLTREAKFAFQLKQSSGAILAGINYVPIRPHIFRSSNGTTNYTLTRLNRVMAATNSYYLQNGIGIQFYFAGTTPDYIDNDDWYNNGYSGQSVDAYDAPNAMNQYYVNFFTTPGLGGYAYYPDNGIYSTRSFILGVNDETDLGNRLVPHELGHNFNLIHTFGQNGGSGTLGSGVTTELVTRGAGANCTTDGDLVCDTPADPYNMTGAYYSYPNGCLQYDPNSPARDANGQAYSPSTTNIMSYYYPCTHDFTPGQQQRMLDALALRQTHTAYTLNAPPTNVTAPSNLTGSVSGNTIVLTWQDNANNEMGYFIERALGNTTNFIAIGGVAPDVTTFTDVNVIPGGQYTYRIRPSNTTTGSLSQLASVAVVPPVVNGLTTTNITGISALLNWNSVGTGITYDLQYRPVGTSTWNSLTNLTNTNYFLTGLTANTTYEWQVKGSAGSVYSTPASFTTTCPTPQYPTSYVARTTASLYWSAAAGQQYTLQWRQQGTPDWSVVDGIPNGNYQLSNLAPSTPHEWRVSATCPGTTTLTTDYTPVQSFTTVACPIPSLGYSNFTSTSVQLSWYTSFNESGRAYNLRYRPVGSTIWATVTGLTTTTYSLTGLITNQAYEMQIQSVCSATDVTTFSSSLTFTPTCQSIYSNYSVPATTTSRLEWYLNYQPEVGSSFEVQYRPAGTTAWTTIPVPIFYTNITFFSYQLTGLATATTYQWRIRMLCSGGGYTDSSIGSFTTGCFNPYGPSVYQIASTGATLTWYATVDPDTRFDLQYRSVGNPNWTTVSSLTATRPSNNSTFVYNLTGLVNNITYEWQVRTVCANAASNSSYVAGYTFTTSCPTPSSLYFTSRPTSVQLNWNNMGAGLSYDFRYRRSGNSEWIYSPSTTETTYWLTGLQSSTNYEWQVRTRCSDGAYSAYSYQSSFYTSSCNTPYAFNVANPASTSIALNWSYYYGDPTMTFEVRYRVANTDSWTTTVGSSLTTVYTSYSLALNGLKPDTQYEWQIRTLCSESVNSGFVFAGLFTTCGANLYTIRNGYWNDPTVWSCGRVPASTDVVEIRHDVRLLGGYPAAARQIRYTTGKRLTFEPSARLVLTP